MILSNRTRIPVSSSPSVDVDNVSLLMMSNTERLEIFVPFFSHNVSYFSRVSQSQPPQKQSFSIIFMKMHLYIAGHIATSIPNGCKSITLIIIKRFHKLCFQNIMLFQLFHLARSLFQSTDSNRCAAALQSYIGLLFSD